MRTSKGITNIILCNLSIYFEMKNKSQYFHIFYRVNNQNIKQINL